MLSKLKELSKDTAVYGISTVLARLLGFILIPFLTQFFTRDQMGIYGNIYAYIAFFNIFYIYGMDAAFLKYASVNENKNLKDIFSTPYIFIASTGLFFSVILITFHNPISAAMKVPANYSHLLIYTVFIIFFDTAAIIPFAHLRLQRKSMKFAVIKIINISINLIMNIVLIWGYHADIDAIFISNAAASVVTFLILTPEIFKYFHFSINTEILKKMLKFGLPYLPAALAATMVQVIDRPILTYMTNEATVGIYTTNYKLGISMMLFVGMFQYAWQPFFLMNAKEKNAKEIFAKVLTLFMIIGSVILIIISLFVDDIASFNIYHGRTLIAHQFLSGLPIVPIILLSYLFNGMYLNFTAGIYIKEKMYAFPIATGVAALANVTINLWLIPIWGIMGAAFATLVSYVVMCAILYYYTQKYYYIQYEYRKVFTILGMIFAAGGIYYYLLFSGNLHFVYKIIILFGFLLSLLIFRVIEKKEIVTTYKMLLGKK